MKRARVALFTAALVLLAGCAKIRVSAPERQALAYREVSIAAHSGALKFSYAEFEDDGDFDARGATLAEVIAKAYDVPSRLIKALITGGPDWAYSRSEQYDTHGSAPNWSVGPWLPRQVSVERRRQMLRRLLAERFGLSLRIANRRSPVYLMTAAKGGVKLKPAGVEEQNCPIYATTWSVACHLINGGQGQGIFGRAATLRDLSNAAQLYSDRPIVDRTKAKGLYEIRTGPWRDMEYAFTVAPAGAKQDGYALASLPNLFQAFEKLGLDLKPGAAKVQVYEIEAVRRPSGDDLE